MSTDQFSSSGWLLYNNHKDQTCRLTSATIRRARCKKFVPSTTYCEYPYETSEVRMAKAQLGLPPGFSMNDIIQKAFPIIYHQRKSIGTRPRTDSECLDKVLLRHAPAPTFEPLTELSILRSGAAKAIADHEWRVARAKGYTRILDILVEKKIKQSEPQSQQKTFVNDTAPSAKTKLPCKEDDFGARIAEVMMANMSLESAGFRDGGEVIPQMKVPKVRPPSPPSVRPPTRHLPTGTTKSTRQALTTISESHSHVHMYGEDDVPKAENINVYRERYLPFLTSSDEVETVDSPNKAPQGDIDFGQKRTRTLQSTASCEESSGHLSPRLNKPVPSVQTEPLPTEKILKSSQEVKQLSKSKEQLLRTKQFLRQRLSSTLEVATKQNTEKLDSNKSPKQRLITNIELITKQPLLLCEQLPSPKQQMEVVAEQKPEQLSTSKMEQKERVTDKSQLLAEQLSSILQIVAQQKAELQINATKMKLTAGEQPEQTNSTKSPRTMKLPDNVLSLSKLTSKMRESELSTTKQQPEQASAKKLTSAKHKPKLSTKQQPEKGSDKKLTNAKHESKLSTTKQRPEQAISAKKLTKTKDESKVPTTKQLLEQVMTVKKLTSTKHEPMLSTTKQLTEQVTSAKKQSYTGQKPEITVSPTKLASTEWESEQPVIAKKLVSTSQQSMHLLCTMECSPTMKQSLQVVGIGKLPKESGQSFTGRSHTSDRQQPQQHLRTELLSSTRKESEQTFRAGRLSCTKQLPELATKCTIREQSLSECKISEARQQPEKSRKLTSLQAFPSTKDIVTVQHVPIIMQKQQDHRNGAKCPLSHVLSQCQKLPDIFMKQSLHKSYSTTHTAKTESPGPLEESGQALTAGSLRKSISAPTQNVVPSLIPTPPRQKRSDKLQMSMYRKYKPLKSFG